MDKLKLLADIENIKDKLEDTQEDELFILVENLIFDYFTQEEINKVVADQYKD